MTDRAPDDGGTKLKKTTCEPTTEGELINHEEADSAQRSRKQESGVTALPRLRQREDARSGAMKGTHERRKYGSRTTPRRAETPRQYKNCSTHKRSGGHHIRSADCKTEEKPGRA